MITNFKLFEFFKEKEHAILYHGSNKEFDNFNDELVGKGEGGDLFGKGFYLTNNIEVANFYGKVITKKEKILKYTPTGIFGSDVPVFDKGADEHANKNFKVNKFEINGYILNIKDFKIDKKFQQYIQDVLDNNDSNFKDSLNYFLNYYRDNKNKINNNRGELWYIIHQCVVGDKKILEEIIDYIKKLGFDGLKYESDKSYEGEGSWNYVIYNKNIIKKI